MLPEVGMEGKQVQVGEASAPEASGCEAAVLHSDRFCPATV